MDEYPEFTSLCSVWTDSIDRIRLARLADLKDGSLSFPDIDEDLPKLFGNRDRLHRSDGPSRDGSIGIWLWRAVPNETDVSRDYIISKFQQDLRPTRFVQIKPVTSLEQLSEHLIEGIPGYKYICDTIFGYEKEPGVYEGLLCTAEELIFEDKTYLKEDVCSLPIYHFDQDELITIKSNLRFMRNIPLFSSSKSFTIGNLYENIKSIIADRMTWPLYKECIGRTKAEWRNCKTLFDRACGESLYETISRKMSCSVDEAIELVHDFAERAHTMFEAGDIDSDILAQIAMNHDDLRTRCETTLEEHWKIAHADELAKAQAEVEKKQKDAENIVNECNAQLEKIKAAKKSAEAEHQKILENIEENQSKLEQLIKEIEEYEALGANTVQAIRDKIGAARKDMAGFIAELSPFMSQPLMQNNVPCEMKQENRWKFIPGTVCEEEDDIEDCIDWKETLMLLSDNLQIAGVGTQWTDMLSYFLYSAYLNKMPLLLAGPNAKAIANALSMTVHGKTMDLLQCYGEQDSEAAEFYATSELAAVQNPFHPDWITSMHQPETGFTLWLHPFTEDLQIEPRSLYHYAYPVFTECFVDQFPLNENMLAGHNVEKYKAYQSDSRERAKMGQIKKLGMSRLLVNRLEKVLTDAKSMRKVSDSSMEFLFGILPLCVLSGKQEVLSELLDEEKNIAPEVKTELQRFIEE